MRRVSLLLSILLLAWMVQPPAVHALAPAAGCQWLYSAGGVGQFANLFNDPDGTPLSSMRFGAPFVERRGPTGNVARNGYLDFDGNGVQDVSVHRLMPVRRPTLCPYAPKK